jgi:hypothetical protein
MHEKSTHFGVPSGTEYALPQHSREVSDALSEASALELSYLRALNRSEPTPHSSTQLKEPRVSDDFAQRLTALDDEIFARGVAVDRKKLVAVGKQGFNVLLECDRVARLEHRVIGRERHSVTDRKGQRRAASGSNSAFDWSEG